MTYARWGTVIAILFVVCAVTVSAQILGGDPMSSAALTMKNMVTLTVRILAGIAVVILGLKWATGHGSAADAVGMVIGLALVFQPDRLTSLMFPGATP
jgi:type IV secretory pathway VirB2 component (pilin)